MRGDVGFFCDRFDNAFGGLPAQWRRVLIALQSDGGGVKSCAAAQRILDLLARLRMQKLEGEKNADAPEALSNAASARVHAAADKIYRIFTIKLRCATASNSPSSDAESPREQLKINILFLSKFCDGGSKNQPLSLAGLAVIQAAPWPGRQSTALRKRRLKYVGE